MTATGTHVLFSGGGCVRIAKESEGAKGTYQLGERQIMKSKESERAGYTHELVSAHRRTSQRIGEKASDSGGLTSCRIRMEGKVKESKPIWPVKVTAPTSWGEKEVRVRMRKESK
jgi:hypothetical protein